MSSRRLGRYQLHERLGAGPVGEVYRATIYGVAGSAVVFAVKRIHDHIAASEDLMAAIGRGARVYANVDHQYVARFRELGNSEREHYVATDWIYGMDVARLVAANRANGTTVPMPVALTITCHAARSIAGVHASGLMHLGVAPRNVLLTPAGDVITTDVGMFAALLSERSPRELTLGDRAAYLAPEQWRQGTCTLATDVWALGALCIELVSGQPAAGVSMEAAEANIISGNLVRAVVPAPIASVLNRATAVDPSHRFTSAILFAEALEAAMRSSMASPSQNEIAEIVRQAQVAEAGVRTEEQSGLLTVRSLAQSQLSPRPGSISGVGPAATPTPTLAGHPYGRTLRPGDIPPPPPMSSPGMVALRPMPTLDSLASVTTAPPPTRRPATNEHTTPIDETDLITIRAETNDANLFDITQQGARTMRESVPPPSQVSLHAVEPVDATIPNERGEPFRSRQDLPPIPVVGRRTSQLPIGMTLPNVAPTPASMQPPADLINLEFGEPLPPGSQPIELPRAITGGSGRARSAPLPPEQLASAPYQHTAVTQPPLISASASSQFAPTEANPTLKAKRSRLVTITVLTACVALAGLGVLAWQTYEKGRVASTDSPTPAPTPTPAVVVARDAGPADAKAAAIAADAAAGVTADAALPDAAMVAAAVDARAVDATQPIAQVTPEPTPTPTPTPNPSPAATTANALPTHVSASAQIVSDPAPAGQFIIDSVPAAVVYVDGTNKGKTPVTLPAANDTFTVALFAEGYALYSGKLSGTSQHKVTLTKAERFAGAGGIRVQCKEKKRYYVLVDGRHTGEMCPTDRLGVRLGMHKIEVVDLVGGAYRELPLDVDNDKKSLRISVD